jgi:hypothetical protein
LLAGFIAVCGAELVVGGLLWTAGLSTPAWSCSSSRSSLPIESARPPFGPVFGAIRTVLVILALGTDYAM